MKLGFLVSGNGGNLKFFNKCIQKRYLDGVELVVIADRDCGALQFARNRKIDNYKIAYSRDNNNELLALLKKLDLDMIVTNIHKIIDAEIVKLFTGKLINLHYSLLPAFAGMIGEDPIINAIKKTKFVGVTVHYVENDVDSGDIIIQGLIKNNGEPPTIINKVFRMGCFALLFAAIEKLPHIKGSTLAGVCEEDELIFSPVLNYNYKCFDESFWNEVRSDA